MCFISEPLKKLHESPGTDAAAGAAAAFAACSNLYAGRSLGSAYSAPASLQNATYANTLLTHAQQLYSFAVNTAPQQTYQTSVPAVGEAYPSSGYGDDLAIAALLLSWATNSSSLYSDAQNYYTQFGLAANVDVFNWDSKTPGIPVLFAQLPQARLTFAGNLSGWQNQAEQYFDSLVSGQQRTRGMSSGRHTSAFI